MLTIFVNFFFFINHAKTEAISHIVFYFKKCSKKFALYQESYLIGY